MHRRSAFPGRALALMTMPCTALPPVASSRTGHETGVSARDAVLPVTDGLARATSLDAVSLAVRLSTDGAGNLEYFPAALWGQDDPRFASCEGAAAFLDTTAGRMAQLSIAE